MDIYTTTPSSPTLLSNTLSNTPLQHSLPTLRPSASPSYVTTPPFFSSVCIPFFLYISHFVFSTCLTQRQRLMRVALRRLARVRMCGARTAPRVGMAGYTSASISEPPPPPHTSSPTRDIHAVCVCVCARARVFHACTRTAHTPSRISAPPMHPPPPWQ